MSSPLGPIRKAAIADDRSPWRRVFKSPPHAVGAHVTTGRSRAVAGQAVIFDLRGGRAGAGPIRAPHPVAYQVVAGASIGFQMLFLCVSGIRKRASTKHTAGTKIG